MILFDTETTGLVQPEGTPLSQQPRIIEFAALKVRDDGLDEIAWLEFICNPGIVIPPEITKITGIGPSEVDGKPPFSAHYPDLVDFFIGETTLVAHNAAFDVALLKFELMRLGKQFNFPWPWKHLCTVELTEHIAIADAVKKTHSTGKKGHSLVNVYRHFTGMEHAGAHRAHGDVLALYEIVKRLRKDGIL